MADLSSYIKNVTDQEIKVLLLKLKNEMRKEDARGSRYSRYWPRWEQKQRQQRQPCAKRHNLFSCVINRARKKPHEKHTDDKPD